MERPLAPDPADTGVGTSEGMTDGVSPALRLFIDRMTLPDGAMLFEDFALDLAAGGWTCILGPSGVGKSTMLRVMCSLATHGTTGSVTASDGAPVQGRVAYMAQSDLLMPWRDVLGNAMLGSSLRGQNSNAHRARATALLAELGLRDATRLYPAALSGGMRQRVALARTLLENRPFLAMDEPFSALDAINRHRLQDLGARMLAGRTVAMVTHDPWEALRLGTRLIVLAGRPARIALDLSPSGARPRSLGDLEIAGLYAEVMGVLAAGDPPPQPRLAPAQ